MFLFLLFGMGLAFAWLYVAVYPGKERHQAQRAMLQGAIASLPLWYIARFFGSLIHPYWDSQLIISLHEALDRVVPYAFLPLAGYAVFWRLGRPSGESNQDRKSERSISLRRLTAFYAGCLTPACIGEMARIMPNSDLQTILFLPITLSCIALGLPNAILRWQSGTLLVRIAVGLVSGIILSLLTLPPWLMAARYWLPALVIPPACFAAVLLIALPALRAAPSEA
ncbi:MAG: hypothetical protein WCQ50_17035 [Spirochaetota bacterium]